MKTKLVTLKRYASAMLAVAAMGLTSCQPDEFGSGNPISQDDVDASFVVAQTDNAGNHYSVTGKEDGEGHLLFHRWDLGDGTPEFAGDYSQDIFFPDAGTYTVKHTAYGDGASSNTSVQTIVVPTSDPNAGNLVKGGKFRTAADIAEWTVLNISASGAAVAFTQGTADSNGYATFTAGGYNQKAIYQTIQVEAGKQYKIDMTVSTPGVNETWFEVYASPVAPSQGNDYSAGGKVMQLNTWAGCGLTPVNGLLSQVGCGDGSIGPVVSFPTSGTIYLLIKCGGNQNTAGVSVSNISMRGI